MRQLTREILDEFYSDPKSKEGCTVLANLLSASVAARCQDGSNPKFDRSWKKRFRRRDDIDKALHVASSFATCFCAIEDESMKAATRWRAIEEDVCLRP